MPDYVNYPQMGRANERRDSITGMEGGWMYKLIPNIPNIPLDSHRTGQTPDHRESYYLLFGIPPPALPPRMTVTLGSSP